MNKNLNPSNSRQLEMNVEKAIEQLEMFADCSYYYRNGRVIQPEYFFPALKQAIEALKEKEERTNNGWISVDDRLPDKEVLATCNAPDVYGYKECLLGYVCASFNSPTGYVCESYNAMLYVTHWQPLPEPPKDGGK